MLTGRTSSIGQHTLCLDSKGGILNDPAFRTQSIADYVKQSSKVGCRAVMVMLGMLCAGQLCAGSPTAAVDCTGPTSVL